VLTSKPIKIKSSFPPIVDPRGVYFKKVTIE